MPHDPPAPGPLPTPAPRLFVIMARVAPVAVVLRRGPAGWARLTTWNTERDELTHGAWFHGTGS